jgi:hypothetical protein
LLRLQGRREEVVYACLLGVLLLRVERTLEPSWLALDRREWLDSSWISKWACGRLVLHKALVWLETSGLRHHVLLVWVASHLGLELLIILLLLLLLLLLHSHLVHLS